MNGRQRFCRPQTNPENTGETGVFDTAGSATGSAPDEDGMVSHDLQAIIDAWPGLPEASKTGIVAMVKAAGLRS
jgi:hypothetical protein